MSPWLDRFKNKKTPTADDIRIQIKQTERDQHKKRRELEIKEREKTGMITAAKTAKERGKNELLRDQFRQLRQMEIANGYLNKDLKRLSLEKVALTALERKVALAERQESGRSAERLIKDLMSSPIGQAIDKGEVAEEAFIELLDETLGDEELALNTDQVKEDEGFANFEQALIQVINAEAGAEDEDLTKALGEVERAIKSERAEDA